MKKQKSFESAFNLAVENLKKFDFDTLIEKIVLSGGVILESDKNSNEFKFNIPLFNHSYIIKYPEFEFTSPTEKVISLVTKIIILHYIELSGDNIKDSNELVSYKHIPGAFNYYPVFRKKAIIPILNRKLNISILEKASEKLHAVKKELGDFSFEVQAFPNIKITVIFYEGDEDFDNSLDFLFDSSIEKRLSLEDIVVISQMLSKRLLFYLENC